MQLGLLWASKGCRRGLGVRGRGEREGTGQEPGSSLLLSHSPGPALGQGHLIGTRCPADKQPRQGLQAFPLPPAAPHPALQCMAGC